MRVRRRRCRLIGGCCVVASITLVWLFYALLDVSLETFDRPHERWQVNQAARRLRPRYYGQFCAIENVLMGTDVGVNRTTLVLHGTHDRVFNVIRKHVYNWQGPVSLAVVLPKTTQSDSLLLWCLFKLFQKFAHEDKDVRRYLSVHFLIPRATICHRVPPRKYVAGCDYETYIESSGPLPLRALQELVNYPVNTARNFARNQVKTHFMVIADLEHFFSAQFEARMSALAARTLTDDDKGPGNGTNCKQVLVYRIFEVSDEAIWPRDKTDLARLLAAREAVVFHSAYSDAHQIPRLQEWLTAPDQGSEGRVQFDHSYDKSDWEPQFVSRTDIPHHDEAFHYPLRDNTVLRWELCRAGYRFLVVHDVFMFHPGIKAAKYKARMDPARQMLVARTYKALRAFARRMHESYPDTGEICPHPDL